MTKPMKRRDRAMKRSGCRLIRHGNRHDVWGCGCGQHRTQSPRHTNTTAGVVGSIAKDLACLPQGWI